MRPPRFRQEPAEPAEAVQIADPRRCGQPEATRRARCCRHSTPNATPPGGLHPMAGVTRPLGARMKAPSASAPPPRSSRSADSRFTRHRNTTMSALERSRESQTPQRSSDNDTLRPGGFGEFSAMYRARWSLNHPRMRRLWPGDNEAQPAALPGAPDVDPESEPVTTSRGTLRRYA